MEILIILILTLLNGFFALSEISIISVKKSRIERKAQAGSSSAKTVLQLLAEPEDFLSAVQVGITLIGIVSGAYAGAALSDDMYRLLVQVPFLAPYASALSIVLVIGLITYFSIVVGELIPKTLALGNSERIALAVAPIIKVFTTLTLPLVKLLSVSTNVVIKLLGVKDPPEEQLSEEELRQIIKTAGKQGVLDKDESDLHQNIFNYSAQRARDLKTHRMDVEWINLQDSIEVIKEKLQRSVHSRFPVYDTVYEKVVGVLTSRDFYENLLGKNLPLKSILLEPLFIPETMYAHAVLNLFRLRKQYLGIVVDEFGSVEGILTLHDILEAIVGDIPDTDELAEPLVVRRDQHSFLVSGSIPVRELNKSLKKKLLEEKSPDFATLAGFVIQHLGRLPEVGEKFAYRDFSFEVVDMDGMKIDKLIVQALTAPAGATSGNPPVA
ncbi:hemolysin family protein [Rufibacter sediminis]|uniref:HlyC/CorC family transporter n=1 Tax=Rufibacter sediminis TaxID=2762756 RepID=A0ABR6VWY9_9BACT|nr:hemolysin family protein [Rufibacter sediminis]MBC3541313.1 HlyC/CorC family transporter [Rufibacter sediminis]